MTIETLINKIKDLGLDKYAFLSVGSIGRGDRRISIVENGGAYDVYISNERGYVDKEGEGLTESRACEMVFSFFEEAKALYEYYEAKGTLEENGYYS